MLELFHSHISTCSQKVRLCLAEKEIDDWVSRPVNLSKQENLTPEFLAINPNGVVPAFRHDGVAIIESTVMCEYLDEVFTGGTALTPANPADRAHMRAWLRFIDEVPSMAIRVPSFRKVFLPHFQKMTEEEFLQFAEANPLRKSFFLKMGRNGFGGEDYQIALDQLSRALGRMDRALEATPFICGSAYTIADCCVTPLLVRMEDIDLLDILEPFRNVADWYRRMQLRPSFAKAYYEGTRISSTRPGYAATGV